MCLAVQGTVAAVLEITFEVPKTMGADTVKAMQRSMAFVFADMARAEWIRLAPEDGSPFFHTFHKTPS